MAMINLGKNHNCIFEHFKNGLFHLKLQTEERKKHVFTVFAVQIAKIIITIFFEIYNSNLRIITINQMISYAA